MRRQRGGAPEYRAWGRSHLRRALNGRLVAPEFCTFEDCGRPHHQGGLCRGHYAQRERGQELRPLRAYRRRT